MDLKALWQYQQVDMEADRFEKKMRQSETRQTLLKHRKFIKEQQDSMARLQQEVSDMSDRVDAIADEADRLEKNLNMLIAAIEQNPPQTEAEVEERYAAVKHLADNLTRYRAELDRMRKDAAEKDRQQQTIRSSAAKILQEYNALKKVYDQEYARDDAQLKKLRKAVDAEGAKLAPDALEHYRDIKQRCTPPIAKLVNGQCSGCFMALPGAALLEAKGGKTLTCDNCGRFLFIEE